MKYGWYRNIIDSFPKFEKILKYSNFILVFIFQIVIIFSIKRILDFNDTILIVIIALSGILSLIINHFTIIAIFKRKLRFQNEKKEFEIFIEKNKLKFPNLKYFFICSVFCFAISSFAVMKDIKKEIEENSIEICCGKIIETKKKLKRSQYIVKYKFSYKLEEYIGVCSFHAIKYNGLYHSEIGVPIFLDDEYKINLHKDKPWHNDINFSSPSENQIQRFKMFITSQNNQNEINNYVDTILNDYGFYGLIAYYHQDKVNIEKIEEPYRTIILSLQNDTSFNELIKKIIKIKNKDIILEWKK